MPSSRAAASQRHLALYAAGPAIVGCGVCAATFMIVEGCRHVLPHKDPAWRFLHLLALALLAANFAFNYTRAIRSNPGAADSDAYHRLLLAALDSGHVAAADYEQQRHGGLDIHSLSDPAMALAGAGPFDWSFCPRSKRLKPPRAHFDSVTQQLVLNMDHYCVRHRPCFTTRAPLPLHYARTFPRADHVHCPRS
jgi:hypothetical protein